ncbi:MAG TPA: YicC/YloC family endoribonuclease [Phycisphaerales bacterium]|nr:YicC/YloC family endoribonuclease [Phycisphaerales bacterium]
MSTNVRSMTGFGEASATQGGAHYFIEIRSLNNKYFKSTVRLPEQVQGLEAEIEQRLRDRLARGTITVNARINDSGETAAYEINTKALSRYIEQIRRVPQLAGESPSLSALLGLPGVLQPPSDEEARFETARAAILPLLEKACDGVLAMREREGRVLVEDVRQNLALIAKRLEQVTGRAPAVVADYELRLKNRIETMLREADHAVETGDLIREIAAYAERTDIAEEIKRLSAHLDQFEELLAGSKGKPIGRTLDFLSQEMLREANTIASKSPDAVISRNIVEIKGSIDRIKEQVQNIE